MRGTFSGFRLPLGSFFRGLSQPMWTVGQPSVADYPSHRSGRGHWCWYTQLPEFAGFSFLGCRCSVYFHLHSPDPPAGADVDGATSEGETPLLVASREGHVKIVKAPPLTPP